MKVVILSGGFGTRLAEETTIKPKPMVSIGEKPILWHIMKHYSHYGHNEFLIALGYKGELVKQYFIDYHYMTSDITVNLVDGRAEVISKKGENWQVHLIDTGMNTKTGGRLRRLKSWLGNESFMLTYGDGVSDINLHELLEFHRQQNLLVTLTSVRPPARFGNISFKSNIVESFMEKPQAGGGWINGGFMVFEPGIFDFLKKDQDSLEKDALENVAKAKQLAAFRHKGFWQCMDTMRDVRYLNSLWESSAPPWKLWD